MLLLDLCVNTFYKQVYYLTRASVKTANKQYSSVDNDYELTFNADTELWPCEDNVELPSINFNFVPISKLDGEQPNSTVGKSTSD